MVLLIQCILLNGDGINSPCLAAVSRGHSAGLKKRVSMLKRNLLEALGTDVEFSAQWAVWGGGGPILPWRLSG